jgi:hypothetical protein
MYLNTFVDPAKSIDLIIDRIVREREEIEMELAELAESVTRAEERIVFLDEMYEQWFEAAGILHSNRVATVL